MNAEERAREAIQAEMREANRRRVNDYRARHPERVVAYKAKCRAADRKLRELYPDELGKYQIAHADDDTTRQTRHHRAASDLRRAHKDEWREIMASLG